MFQLICVLILIVILWEQSTVFRNAPGTGLTSFLLVAAFGSVLHCSFSESEATSRIVEDQLGCSLRLLEFLPVHSDSQGFARAVVWESITPTMTQHFDRALGY